MTHCQRAFTLLELLVVLSLIGLVAGIVAPRFIDASDKLTLKNQLLEVRQKVNGLPLQAQSKESALRIDAQGSPLELPEGWRVTADPPAIYQSNGSCLGGQIEIWKGKTRRDSITLSAPFCQWSS